jgi:eukaryotic-like serine/threonine-protein kinase
VINVTWEDTQLYVAWLKRMTGKDHRLLSEAEWGTPPVGAVPAATFFDDDEAHLDEYAWYSENSNGGPQPVGQKKPNAFGLYDMHGDVWQWVEDAYHDNYDGAPSDGSAWTEGGETGVQVFRGGSSLSDSGNLRTARRLEYTTGHQFDSPGFWLGKTLAP